MSSLDLTKAGIGLAVIIDIAPIVVAGHALFMTFGGIDDLIVAPELFVSVLFGDLTVAAAANVHRVAPKLRIHVWGLNADRTMAPLTSMLRFST